LIDILRSYRYLDGLEYPADVLTAKLGVHLYGEGLLFKNPAELTAKTPDQAFAI